MGEGQQKMYTERYRETHHIDIYRNFVETQNCGDNTQAKDL